MHVGKPIFLPLMCPLITVPSIHQFLPKDLLTSFIFPDEIFDLMIVEDKTFLFFLTELILLFYKKNFSHIF